MYEEADAHIVASTKPCSTCRGSTSHGLSSQLSTKKRKTFTPRQMYMIWGVVDKGEDLDVAEFVDHLEGVKEGGDLGGMIHNGGDAEEDGRAAEILEMPVEEAEDEARAHTNEHHGQEIHDHMG